APLPSTTLFRSAVIDQLIDGAGRRNPNDSTHFDFPVMNTDSISVGQPRRQRRGQYRFRLLYCPDDGSRQPGFSPPWLLRQFGMPGQADEDENDERATRQAEDGTEAMVGRRQPGTLNQPAERQIEQSYQQQHDHEDAAIAQRGA